MQEIFIYHSNFTPFVVPVESSSNGDIVNKHIIVFFLFLFFFFHIRNENGTKEMINKRLLERRTHLLSSNEEEGLGSAARKIFSSKRINKINILESRNINYVAFSNPPKEFYSSMTFKNQFESIL